MKPTKKAVAGINAIGTQITAGANPNEGFLHIGKTGGTGIRSFLAALRDQGLPHPLYLPHGWDNERITAESKISLHLVIRDPLERTVSGFNSRLSQGRPRYNGTWTADEAITYTWFETADALLQAVLSDREIDRSRVNFAFGSINHLKRNYAFYFGKPSKLDETFGNRLGIVEPIEHTNRFLQRLSAAYRIDPGFAETHYEPQHVGTSSSAKVLEQFSPAETKKLKRYLIREYKIYNWLKARSAEQQAAADSSGA